MAIQQDVPVGFFFFRDIENTHLYFGHYSYVITIYIFSNIYQRTVKMIYFPMIFFAKGLHHYEVFYWPRKPSGWDMTMQHDGEKCYFSLKISNIGHI